jgi:hypothetical protein
MLHEKFSNWFCGLLAVQQSKRAPAVLNGPSRTHRWFDYLGRFGHMLPVSDWLHLAPTNQQ